ncbi:MAG: immune inhibitor A [Dehalococcoidia bacterium]|nr:immune inhibitor A [Dehalococcoidia bacterium]
MLSVAIALAACSRSAPPRPSTTPAPARPTAAASPAPRPRDLATQIGVRGDLPTDDPIDLAARYRLTAGQAPASKPFAGEQAVGSQRSFTVLQLSGSALAEQSPPGVVTVTATLKAKSAHAYFYGQNALAASTADMQAAADRFEATVWPKVTAAFGEPAIPGVDGDPRIIVLQADLGSGAGGYFSSDDEYLKSVRPLSNEAEMVYLNRTLAPGSASFNVVLAHEFQHLVHAQDDRDEEAWVNEGLSEDASMLVGGAATSIDAFAKQPQTQLNFWDAQGSAVHYGAGAAFFRYLTSRFGGDASYGALAREPGDGAAGVDQFLAQIGQRLRFRDVFADWIVANILNLKSGPYANPAPPLTVPVTETLQVGSPAGGAASQFGVDYYNLSLDSGDYLLKFTGQASTDVLPVKAPDAGPMIWGNAGDNIDTTLTRSVDLTGATDPALSFKTWYDIERWYDWGYISASTDGGTTWQALAGGRTSSDDPAKAAYGPGYTGESGGGQQGAWVDERVSLARYAGQKILLRFEYVTDGATHGEGWAIDDLAISGAPAVSDAATGWQSSGWVRIDGQLAQTYVVRVIEQLAGGGTRLLVVPVGVSGQGELRLSAAGVQQATLAIAGSTEGTNQKATYRVELNR